MDATFTTPITTDPVVGINIVRVEIKPRETTLTTDLEYVHQSGAIDKVTITKNNGTTFASAVAAVFQPTPVKKLIAWFVANGDVPSTAP